jgi:putative DNA primase/helicase
MGNDGKVLVRCHAGCDQRDLIAALQERGLWQTNGRVSGIALSSAPACRGTRRPSA